MVVVAAIDGESTPDPTLVVGAELADRFDDELVALHVMPQQRYESMREAMGDDRGSGSLSLYPNEGYAESVRRQATEANPYTVDIAQRDASRAARAVVEATLDSPVEVSVQGRVGDPAEAILAEAERRDATYLVIGGRKRTPIGKAIFGSVTQSVLLSAEQPVVTVPKGKSVGESDESQPVVVGIDRTERATRVVEAGSRLADALGGPLHLVHVLSKDEFAELERAEDDVDKSILETATVRDAAEDIANQAATGIDGTFTSVGLVGDPSEQLVAYAEDQDASYLVVSGRRRSPIGKVLFGSVTQSVLLSADCPVLTVFGDE